MVEFPKQPCIQEFAMLSLPNEFIIFLESYRQLFSPSVWGCSNPGHGSDSFPSQAHRFLGHASRWFRRNINISIIRDDVSPPVRCLSGLRIWKKQFLRGMIDDSGLIGFIHRGNESIPELPRLLGNPSDSNLCLKFQTPSLTPFQQNPS